MFGGDISFENLELREEILDTLDTGLPLKLKFGHVGKLQLNFSWANIKSEPVVLILEEVSFY